MRGTHPAPWDDVEGEIAPKSGAGVRLALLPETLRAILAEHVDRTGRSGADLVFGKSATVPLVPTTTGRRARKAWARTCRHCGHVDRAGAERCECFDPLEPVCLHQCRHGFESFMDAAGISEARADRYNGHAGRTVGDRYRHRLRGQLRRPCRP